MPANLSADDRFGIYDLFARHAWTIGTADVDGFANNFTPNGRLSEVQGREAIRQRGVNLVSRPEWAGSQHYNGQLYFDEAEGNRCRVRSYSTIVHRQRDGTVTFKWLGIYRDVCVKVDGLWYFEDRQWEAWNPDKIEEYRPPAS